MAGYVAPHVITTTASLVARHSMTPPQFQGVMFFGFVSAVMTLLFFIHQRQSRRVVLALSISLAAMAVYGFMQGAWPLGIVEVVWSCATFERWRAAKNAGRRCARPEIGAPQWSVQDRLSRMFGTNQWN